MKNYRIIYKLLPLLFMLFLVFPFFNSKMMLFDPGESLEKRILADEPALIQDTIDNFPTAYDNFYNDHFNLRNWYIKWHSYINFAFLNESSYPESVIAGQDGWLFWNKGDFPLDWEKKLYSENELQKIAQFIISRTNYYKEKGADYYLFIVPDKQSIYPEFLPAEIRVEDAENKINRMDQLMDYLASNTNISNVFYLRKEMNRRKAGNRVYKKLDHHWNKLGSFYASSFMLEQISKRHPTVKNDLNFDNFKLEFEKVYDGDLTYMLGINGLSAEVLPVLKITNPDLILEEGELRNYTPTYEFPYPSDYEKVMTTGNPALPKAVIIRDSFAGFMLDQLSYGFNESVYIWDYWMYGLNAEIIEKEKPEVVLNIIIEKNFDDIIKNKL